ncbi:type II secretion system F family protein [Candidatus Woesearchaeota archaeon]|nr:type II secretion system F family protein [Candidatus Woesearchaeota archaeon]
MISFFRRIKRKKEKEKKEGKLEFFRKNEIKRREKTAIAQERKQRLRYYLERAGISINPKAISKRIFSLCIIINLVITSYLLYYYSTNFGYTYAKIFTAMALVWVVVFAAILFIIWMLLYIALDVRVYKRKLDIEEVLPDFLQLTASNIKSGMTIDRALWYAVRPRFGVLAKEIEGVAKDTMGGMDLNDALEKFASKYDSVTLKRSISLLIEGISAGGEIGDLLNKIAINIQELKIMRKEMAANVSTYTIFITFASIIAAPFLFGLSGVLIQVISGIGATLSDLGSTAATSGLGISFGTVGVDYSDFRIFAIVSLVITSFFSAAIVSTIKKGNVKSGIKYIPLFIAVSVTLFLFADFVLGIFLSGFF